VDALCDATVRRGYWAAASGGGGDAGGRLGAARVRVWKMGVGCVRGGVAHAMAMPDGFAA
jgi:hypothetical protein